MELVLSCGRDPRGFWVDDEEEGVRWAGSGEGTSAGHGLLGVDTARRLNAAEVEGNAAEVAFGVRTGGHEGNGGDGGERDLSSLFFGFGFGFSFASTGGGLGGLLIGEVE